MINTLSYQILAYTRWKNTKSHIKIKKNNLPASTQNQRFELPVRSYSVSDIQDFFEYIIRKHQIVTDNPPIRIDVNKKKDYF